MSQENTVQELEELKKRILKAVTKLKITNLEELQKFSQDYFDKNLSWEDSPVRKAMDELITSGIISFRVVNSNLVYWVDKTHEEYRFSYEPTYNAKVQFKDAIGKNKLTLIGNTHSEDLNKFDNSDLEAIEIHYCGKIFQFPNLNELEEFCRTLTAMTDRIRKDLSKIQIVTGEDTDEN